MRAWVVKQSLDMEWGSGAYALDVESPPPDRGVDIAVDVEQ
jgi:hypothetical protein